MRPTYANLVAEVARASRLTKLTTRTVLDTFFAELAKATWEGGGHVVIPRLGSFRVRRRKARSVVAPAEVLPARRMTLPAMRVVVCRVAKNWRRRDG